MRRSSSRVLVAPAVLAGLLLSSCCCPARPPVSTTAAPRQTLPSYAGEWFLNAPGSDSVLTLSPDGRYTQVVNDGIGLDSAGRWRATIDGVVLYMETEEGKQVPFEFPLLLGRRPDGRLWAGAIPFGHGYWLARQRLNYGDGL